MAKVKKTMRGEAPPIFLEHDYTEHDYTEHGFLVSVDKSTTKRRGDPSRVLAEVAMAKSHADAAARHAAAAQSELLLVLPEGYRELVKALRLIANSYDSAAWKQKVAASALKRCGIALKGSR